MRLRDHPLVSFSTHRSWLPVWSWIGGSRDRYLHGEIRLLKEVRIASDERPQKCFLIMEYEAAMYMGCLLIGDATFCRQIFQLLQEHRGETIASIGDTDLSFLN